MPIDVGAGTQWTGVQLNEKDFVLIRDYFERLSGVRLNDTKRALVQSRLAGRLRKLNISGYGDYVRLIQQADQLVERQYFIDTLTTHETRFFRESKHFDYLSEVLKLQKSSVRVWSAACSTGEEPYTLAMVLHAALGNNFELVASDISESSIQTARLGVYPPERCTETPDAYRTKYMLKDVDGRLKVVDSLRSKIVYHKINLMEKLPPSLGLFDVIFLRNMLIYFEPAKQKDILARVIQNLKPDGLLFVGHSEALAGVGLPLQSVRPSVYKIKS